jgi:hypothetical protein
MAFAKQRGEEMVTNITAPLRCLYVIVRRLYRGMHPLDFFQALTFKAAIVVTKEIKNHRLWAAIPICASSELVPFAVNRGRDLAAAARNVQVTQVGPEQYVCQYYEAGAVAAHARRSLNIAMATCSCWNTNTTAFPAKMFLQVCVDGTCSPPTCSSSMPCNPLRCAGSK